MASTYHQYISSPLWEGKCYGKGQFYSILRLYIQILNIESEETLYFFDDVLDDDVNINEFIMDAICRMNKD